MEGKGFKSVFDIPVTDIKGIKHAKLGSLVKGSKALLFVNVASAWGLTDSNYK